MTHFALSPLLEPFLKPIQQPSALQLQNNLVHNPPNALLLQINHQVRLLGRLIGVIHASETLDLARPRLGVDPPLVRLLAVLERSGDVHEVEVTILLHQLPGVLASLLEGGDGGSNDGRA